MTTYTGICIDGPLDGEFAASPTPSFKVLHQSTPPIRRYDDDTTPTSVGPTITVYKHTFWKNGPDTAEIWRPDDMTITDVLNRLVDVYHQFQREKQAQVR